MPPRSPRESDPTEASDVEAGSARNLCGCRTTEAEEPLLAERSETAGQAPTPSTPFAGVRIVELATVVAAPSAGQLFALMGADVVKVESRSGDMWREFAKILQPTRKKKGGSSVAFDVVNRNKTSVQLNFEKPEDRKVLLQLLAEADVFLTNLKTDALRNSDFNFESLRERFPHLICAHLNAWGPTGPNVDFPGYDVGAFWASTGMANLFATPDRIMNYPLGFGDLATGQVLASGISLALLRRLRTGKGMNVSASLFETALWALSPYLNGTAPEASSACRHYRTHDGEVIAVTHELDPTAEVRLCTALGFSSAAAPADLEAKISGMTADSFAALLDAAGLSHARLVTPVDIHNDPPEEFRLASGAPIPGVDDFPYPSPMPFNLAGVPPRGVPQLGDGDRRLKAGTLWEPRAAATGAFRGAPSAAVSDSALLAGIVVLEYSNTASAAVAGAGSLFAELGASVIRVWTEASERLAGALPAPWNVQLHGRKESVKPDVAAAKASGAMLLLTDVHKDQIGFALPASCSVVRFDVGRGAVGSWMLPTGIAAQLRGWDTEQSFKQLPFQVVDLLASYMLFCASAAELYRREQSNRAGVVEADMYRLGLYHAGIINSAYQVAPDFSEAFGKNYGLQDQKDMHPVPSAQQIDLTDGTTVILLGANLKKDLPRLLKALGILWSTLLWVLCALPQVICPCGKETLYDKLRPIFQVINRAVIGVLGKMDKEEFLEFAEEKDWPLYAFVGDIADLAESPQAQALGSFSQIASGLIVRQPLRFEY